MGQSVCQKVMWNMQTDPGSDSYLYLICSSEAEFYNNFHKRSHTNKVCLNGAAVKITSFQSSQVNNE